MNKKYILEYISLFIIFLFILEITFGVLYSKVREHGGYQSLLFLTVITICSLTYKIITKR
jgi:hypothetical protein